MSSNDSQNSGDSDNLCVVCFKNVEIYSIGCCDHAVCFECSTRMRILCKQNECPICRRELPKVLLTKIVEPFSILFPRFERSNLQDRKFGIIFCTLEIQKVYFKLLEHRCHVCVETEHNWPFRTFQQLKDHMRREHELFFCDICSEHLKIFSFERRCYNRQELAHHRRKGDRNNTSHRGHPLCEFCDTRFMDSDELFRHLRRNHLFCHFCDADGKHQYYNSMDDLKRHFKEEHFLCEEGECKSMALTAVFRTDIDLKAHITQEHGRYMSKSATKQARTLELEFTLAPRPRNENMRNRRPYDRRDRYEELIENSYNVEPGGPGGGPTNQPQIFVNPLTSDQFPALGGGSTSTPGNLSLASKNYTKFSNAAFNSNDFPSLSGASNRPAPAVTITANSSGNSAPEVTITRTVRNQQSNQKAKENFPALGGNSKSAGGSTVRLSVNSNNQQQTPKVSIQFNQKPNGAITTQITTSAPSTSQRPGPEVFPTLGAPRPVSQPQWVQPKSKKQEEPKSSKIAACPVLEPTDLSSFPSLSKGKSDKPKKSSSVTVPVDSWVNLNSIKNNPKFSKKAESGRGESNADKIDNGNKGGGDNNNGAKRSDSSKKTGYKGASRANKAQATSSNLDAKLEELKLVDVNDKSKLDDSKKSKKKKTKQSGESVGNSLENDNKDVKKEEYSASKNETMAPATDVNENEEQSNQNGLIKKRSELKIGTLSSSGNVSSSTEDFPALANTKPPPGFVSKPAPVQPQSAVKPPPGFNSSNFPALNISNDLTFTNSSGQSYAISPATSQTYRQPQNFQSRNQNLIKKFMNVFSDNDTIVEFKTLSEKFRKGDVDAKKYHQHCLKIMRDKFEDVFPELLVLLPNIEKQQELYKVLSGKSKDNLVVCENCQQVIYKGELSDHYNHHRLDNHFPSLGSAQQINSAWKK